MRSDKVSALDAPYHNPVVVEQPVSQVETLNSQQQQHTFLVLKVLEGLVTSRHGASTVSDPVVGSITPGSHTLPGGRVSAEAVFP